MLLQIPLSETKLIETQTGVEVQHSATIYEAKDIEEYAVEVDAWMRIMERRASNTEAKLVCYAAHIKLLYFIITTMVLCIVLATIIKF